SAPTLPTYLSTASSLLLLPDFLMLSRSVTVCGLLPIVLHISFLYFFHAEHSNSKWLMLSRWLHPMHFPSPLLIKRSFPSDFRNTPNLRRFITTSSLLLPLVCMLSPIPCA